MINVIKESVCLNTYLPDLDNIQESSGSSIMEIVEKASFENEKNWYLIENYIDMRQLQESVSNNRDYILTEGFIGDFCNKMKEYTVTFYKKVAGMFKKFIAMMNSLILTDKEFVKKYSKEIMKVSLTDKFKYKGYKFTLDKVDISNFNPLNLIEDNGVDNLFKKVTINSSEGNINIADGDEEDANILLGKYYDDTEHYNEIINARMYKQICSSNNSTSMDAKEFREALFEALRNGNSVKETLDKSDIDLGICINRITSYKEAKKNAENNLKNMKTNCDKIIKLFDKLGTNLAKPDNGSSVSNATKIKYAHIAANTLRKGLGLGQVGYGIYLSALKAENRQCKNICVKAMTLSKEAFKESTEIYGNDMSKIQLI